MLASSTSFPSISQTIPPDASSAYLPFCPHPNGNVYVSRISDLWTDTQGFIARDDKKKEIVVVLRGSVSIQNYITDISIFLTPLVVRGVIEKEPARVHSGFLNAWNAVATSTIKAIRDELAQHPGYSIVVSGHSLGGALASLAGISLKRAFPSVPLRVFTYGQPRTGNEDYALLLNKEIGTRNLYRGVHTWDGVPTIIPTAAGYRHHGTEYWSTVDPVTPENTRACDPNGEDLSCSAQIFSTGINPPHTVYYNILAGTPYCI
ncbi:hypothetical protein H1R20_g2933, partial [Candolleomyces eurysporus]